jgi:SAM-dependent methyltransferase
MPNKKKNPAHRMMSGAINKLHLKFFASRINAFGKAKQCYICGKTFSHFNKLWGGNAKVPLWIQALDGVGSDLDNFGCPFCGCHDRERHLFLYFDRLKLWPKNSDSVLHFAPETKLFQRIEACQPLEYVKADFSPEIYKERGISDVQKIDLMDIPFEDNHFNLLLCNHILEHVPDLKHGLREIYRVLKPRGVAILQTPFSRLLHHHFEDPGICGEELCEIFHGQNDHVRTLSEHQFFKDLEDAGFRLEIVKHGDIITPEETKRYGVNPKEDLIRVVKP